MYHLAVKRDFIAQHFLVGGDWGAENELHSHHYQVEIVLEGNSLGEHGYLVDIVDVEHNLEVLVDHYQDNVLNEMPEFSGLNPSIEHFSRIMCHSLSSRIEAANIRAIRVKMWENDIAWASFRLER